MSTALVVNQPKVKESNMYDSPIKARIRSAVRFVQEHQTLVACAATAVVTAKMTRDNEIQAMKDTVAYFINNEGAKAALQQDMASFIDARGLSEEFFAWAPRMRRE